MNINLIFYAFTMCAFLFGCASVNSNSANINIEKESSGLISFERVNVRSDDSTLTVSGDLHARTRSVARGHIDITFISPDEVVLHELTTSIKRRSLKNRHMHFHVNVPLVLPEGSTVRLVHHRKSHNGNG
ncbi:MAG: hypothetical protein ACRBDX_00970 [Gammaproteobacteria bacterium]